MLQGQAYLREPIQHVILAPILQLPSSLLLLLVLILNSSLQIATVRVVHHDVQVNLILLVTLRVEGMLERDHVMVVELTHDLEFAVLVSLVLVNLLDSNGFKVLVASGLVNDTK